MRFAICLTTGDPASAARLAADAEAAGWDGVFTFDAIAIPGVELWVVGAWPSERSMRRAIRWDGILPQPLASGGTSHDLTPATLTDVVAWIGRERPRDAGPFDVVVQGTTPPDPAEAGAVVRPWRDAGATWWVEAPWQGATVESLRDRIVAGPPEP